MMDDGQGEAENALTADRVHVVCYFFCLGSRSG
jgi:hypothetical protein